MTPDLVLDVAASLRNGLMSSLFDSMLPFEDLEDLDFRDLSMGPRVSCSHNSPQYHYGPVSISES